MTSTSPPLDPKPLRIHVLDVGHGDSIVMEFPNGRFGVVDCHIGPRSEAAGEPDAIRFFRKVKAARGDDPVVVEFVCLTHPHLDHYRGMHQLVAYLEEIGAKVNRFWDFGPSAEVALATGDAAEAALNGVALEETEELALLCEWLAPRFDDPEFDYEMLSSPRTALYAEGDLRIDAIAPDSKIAGQYLRYQSVPADKRRRKGERKGGRLSHVKNDNTISSAFLVAYGEFRAVLGGDVTNRSWERLLKSCGVTSCHMIKLSHHGSADGNLPGGECLPVRLGLVQGGAVVISGGYRRELPARKIVKKVLDGGFKLHCTGRIGGGEPTASAPPQTPDDLRDPLGSVVSRPSERSGHGDVEILGYPNGDWMSKTEFDDCPIPDDWLSDLPVG